MVTIRSETTTWLNEARTDREDAARRLTETASMSTNGAGALFMSAEHALKSVAAARYGSALPGALRTHSLVGFSQRIGLWPHIPAELQGYLGDIGRFDPNVR